MRKFVLFTLLLSSSLVTLAQSHFKRNDIYLEAGGNGLFGSVNYERQLTKAPGLGIRAGIGFYTEDAFYLTIPVGINYLFALKKQNNFIEAGLGATWATENAVFFSKSDADNKQFTSFIPNIAYRKHTTQNVMWRVSIAPVANKYGLLPWLGVAVGKRF